MLPEFPNGAGLTAIAPGKLLAHEEFPTQVASAALAFLTG
jgi:hypothetical protein